MKIKTHEYPLLKSKADIIILEEGDGFSNESCFIFSLKKAKIFLSRDYSRVNNVKKFLINHEIAHANLLSKIIDKRLSITKLNFAIIILYSLIYTKDLWLLTILIISGSASIIWGNESSIHENRTSFMEIIADYLSFKLLSLDVNDDSFLEVVHFLSRIRRRTGKYENNEWGNFLYELFEKYKAPPVYIRNKEYIKEKKVISNCLNEMFEYILNTHYVNEYKMTIFMSLIAAIGSSLIIASSSLDGGEIPWISVSPFLVIILSYSLRDEFENSLKSLNIMINIFLIENFHLKLNK